ncbi:hypothetical protein CN327_29255, partial [Bacillus cereus]
FTSNNDNYVNKLSIRAAYCIFVLAKGFSIASCFLTNCRSGIFDAYTNKTSYKKGLFVPIF